MTSYFLPEQSLDRTVRMLRTDIVTALDWSDWQLDKAKMSTFADALLQNKTLRDLTMRHEDLSSVNGAPLLAFVLLRHCSLQTLRLFDTHVDARGAQLLSAALRFQHSLTWLYLRDNDIGNVGAAALGDVLRKNSALKTLCLLRCHVSARGARALAAALHVNCTLSFLNMDYNCVGNAGARFFANALYVNKSLRGLVLTRNKIGGAGMRALAKSLPRNNTLQMLDVCDNGSRSDALLAFAMHGLHLNHTLHTLGVTYNNMGPKGRRAFAKALRTNAALVRVDSPELNRYEGVARNRVFQCRRQTFMRQCIGLYRVALQMCRSHSTLLPQIIVFDAHMCMWLISGLHFD